MAIRSRLKKIREGMSNKPTRLLRVNVFKTDEKYQNPQPLDDMEMDKVSKGLMKALNREDLSGTVEFQEEEAVLDD